jgi:hypothetical protein
MRFQTLITLVETTSQFTFTNIRTQLTRVYSATVSPCAIAFSFLLVCHLGHMLYIIHVLPYFNSYVHPVLINVILTLVHPVVCHFNSCTHSCFVILTLVHPVVLCYFNSYTSSCLYVILTLVHPVV